ncbi:MAG: MOSC domain-containing protein [Pseudomonadota bacterium]|nr:MOSC domain-containing protein [Pseudomonadota bacterium]
MQLESVNIGKLQTHLWRDGTESGLHKAPVHGLIEVNSTGLQGDEQADLKNHGGVDKAVFVMPAENYKKFRVDQPYGFLGENLTISGLDENLVCLGDRFRVGGVLLEVSQPRSPCWKLGEHAKTQPAWKTASDFLKEYSESGCVGFYCRVIEEGLLQQGDQVERFADTQSSVHGCMSIHDLFLAKQFHKTDKDWLLLASAIDHPALSKAWHKAIKGLLAQQEMYQK